MAELSKYMQDPDDDKAPPSPAVILMAASEPEKADTRVLKFMADERHAPELESAANIMGRDPTALLSQIWEVLEQREEGREPS